jgi:hypothetical protein
LNTSCLLQDLSNNRKVGLKMAANSASNVTETLKNGRLELIGERGTL